MKIYPLVKTRFLCYNICAYVLQSQPQVIPIIDILYPHSQNIKSAIPTSDTPYKKKIFEFKKLKETKKLTKDTYLSTELHSIVSRLLATEIKKKYTITGYKEFKQTCYLPEFSYINRHKGGRLFQLIISMMQNKNTLSAFLILRFIYPLTLINTKRKI